MSTHGSACCITPQQFEESVQDVLDWADMPVCPYCGERGGEPVIYEGRSPSRWYNGEEGDPGDMGGEKCTLCDRRQPDPEPFF